MNVLRKAMAREVEALKPLLDTVYAAILGHQRAPNASSDATLRQAMEPAIGALMAFRPLLPAYKAADFDLLEREWRHLDPGDLIMLFDHCVHIMHVRLERQRSDVEAGQPWSSTLLHLLDSYRGAPSMGPVSGDFLCSGVGASGGRARGTARLIRATADLKRVGAGDIVVCSISSPSWLSALRSAAALVADGGGMLSHPAILARELHIPCVVGCGDATAKIADGATLEVDGDLGLVMAAQGVAGGEAR